jgi:hypothetical protein
LTDRGAFPANDLEGQSMMTIEEIEFACDASEPLDFSRHEVAVPALSHGEILYPLGNLCTSLQPARYLNKL